MARSAQLGAPISKTAPSGRTPGRVAGALFLAAFLLYGVGNALSNTWLGLTLMLANSAAVAAIGALVGVWSPRTTTGPESAGIRTCP